MNLYRVILKFEYDYQKDFNFLIVANNIKNAGMLAKKMFAEYDYGSFRFHSIELLASEGQYANPEILLLDNHTRKLDKLDENEKENF